MAKNAPLENVPKNYGRVLPPSFGQNPKESIFSQENVPKRARQLTLRLVCSRMKAIHEGKKQVAGIEIVSGVFRVFWPNAKKIGGG